MTRATEYRAQRRREGIVGREYLAGYDAGRDDVRALVERAVYGSEGPDDLVRQLALICKDGES